MAREVHGKSAGGGFGGGNCVAYARQVTGIRLDGNAAAWWTHAEGRYDRGHQPSVGAILVFKPYGGMHVGHVAVVSRVVGPREVLVDQANWVRGRVTKAMSVVDASPLNDWTSVKVIEPYSGTHGRENPTFGFIYPRAIPASFGETIAEPERPARHREERTPRTTSLPAGAGAGAGEAIAEPHQAARHHAASATTVSAQPPHDKLRHTAKEADRADPAKPLAAKPAERHPRKPADTKITVVF
jgi:surface antigen